MEYAAAEAFSGSESPSSPDEDTKPTVNSATLNQAVSEILDLFIEEESMWVVTQIGRELRYGELEELGVLDDIPEEFQVVNAPGLDIFGQPISKTNKANFECECPKCKRTLAAARFAQHLEKCMGMGRNSSRIASRRLAAASTATSSSSSNNAGAEAKSASQGSSSSSTNSQMNGDMGLGTDDEHFSEDDDEDWTMEKKKKTKKGADKGTPKRKGPVNRLKTSEAGQGKRKVVSPSVSVAASPLSSEVLTGADEDFTLGVLLPPSQ